MYKNMNIVRVAKRSDKQRGFERIEPECWSANSFDQHAFVMFACWSCRFHEQHKRRWLEQPNRQSLATRSIDWATASQNQHAVVALPVPGDRKKTTAGNQLQINRLRGFSLSPVQRASTHTLVFALGIVKTYPANALPSPPPPGLADQSLSPQLHLQASSDHAKIPGSLRACDC